MKLKNNGEIAIQPMTQPIPGSDKVEPIFRLTVKRGSVQALVDLTLDEVLDLIVPVMQYTNK